MEDDAQFAAATAKRKMDKKDSEANKKAYYEALAKYEFISKELGDQSPAKLAEKARKVKAAAKAALQELAASLTRAKNVKDVLAAIGKASKNTSVLPTLLKEARTDATMKKVLGIVADDEKMAKLLAEELLKATSEDMVADAFAEVAEQAVSQGTNDPEVIMRAKLDALVGKYVMQGEIGMAKIKDTFNNAAEQASTPEALDAALTFAAQSAEAKMGEIDAALVEQSHHWPELMISLMLEPQSALHWVPVELRSDSTTPEWPPGSRQRTSTDNSMKDCNRLTLLPEFSNSLSRLVHSPQTPKTTLLPNSTRS
jgi:hypothetical protein